MEKFDSETAIFDSYGNLIVGDYLTQKSTVVLDNPFGKGTIYHEQCVKQELF